MQSELLASKCDLFQRHFGNLRVSATPGNSCYFHSHLSLETAFPALKLTQNCYITMNLKTSKLILNCVRPLSPTNLLYLKDYPHNLTKYEIKKTSKISISQLFSELVTILKHNLGFILKKTFFYLFFPRIGKNWEVQQ